MDDYYGDGLNENPPSRSKRTESVEDSETETTLIPKSLFPGKDCEPGEKLRVEVVRVMENELMVKGAGYDKDDSDDEEGGEEVVEEVESEEVGLYD